MICSFTRPLPLREGKFSTGFHRSWARRARRANRRVHCVPASGRPSPSRLDPGADEVELLEAQGNAAPSLFVLVVGHAGFAQVELSFNSAPRLVLQPALTIELIDPLPLGRDQQKLDLVVKLAVFVTTVGPLMSVLEMLQSIPQLGAKRMDDVFRQLAFDRKPVQTRDGRLDGALSGAQFLGPVGALLS